LRAAGSAARTVSAVMAKAKHVAIRNLCIPTLNITDSIVIQMRRLAEPPRPRRSLRRPFLRAK
jgi:hypothetical protein